MANLVNEAALFSARESRRVVSMLEFEKAKDKIMMGAERRSMVMTEEQKNDRPITKRVTPSLVAWCRIMTRSIRSPLSRAAVRWV
ncbi:hypothetical protein ACNKHQ_18485 [Shigella flexneri]